MRKVVFVLAPNVHILDLAGPAQVFGSAADLGHQYELSYVADVADVPTHQGLTLRAQTKWPDLGPDDLLVIPGWRAPRLGVNGKLRRGTDDAIRNHHANGGTVASICAGADVLGRVGLLDGRRCTTHHDLQDELARRYPKALVVRDVLFVSDDRVMTSAGIASGIDLALHIVGTRHGPAAAAKIARTMVVYARRNGDQAQQSVMLQHRFHLVDVVHRTQDVIDSRFAERLPIDDLASRVGVSVRTLTRAFHTTIGLTPLQYQQMIRLEQANHLVGEGSTYESAARAVGFSDARMLRRLRSTKAAGLSERF
jgi:transcriptional regulator GlxA family with amidase domain